MPKSIRMVSLDVELNERLKQEGNASALIEKVMSEYFKEIDNPYLKMTPEERAFVKKKLLIMAEAEEKIKQLEVQNGKQD